MWITFRIYRRLLWDNICAQHSISKTSIPCKTQKCRKMNRWGNLWNSSGKLYSKWNLTAWTSSYKSLKRVSTRVHPSLNLSPRSLQRLWMICSNEQINTLCSRMTVAQLLNRSWAPVDLPKTTQLGALKPRANEGNWVEGKANGSSHTKPTSPPLTINTRNFSPWSVSYLISNGHNQ